MDDQGKTAEDLIPIAIGAVIAGRTAPGGRVAAPAKETLMSHFWGSIESLLYFLLLAGAFFLMMRFGCGAHVHGHGPGRDRDTAGSRPTTTATDPVCGMSVATRDAKSSVHDGVAYYFCSIQCREAFETSPGKYLKKAPTSRHPQHEVHSHG